MRRQFTHAILVSFSVTVERGQQKRKRIVVMRDDIVLAEAQGYLMLDPSKEVTFAHDDKAEENLVRDREDVYSDVLVSGYQFGPAYR